MMEFLTQFHFLRPLWLLALLPMAWLVYYLWHNHKKTTGLESYIKPHLLKHLTLENSAKPSRLPMITLTVIWLLTLLALAGPTWKKRPQPLFESEMATIILLDLSPSMRAEDIKPSRIIRAHLKIQDFLSEYKEGLTALIVYAGEAHIVTPLTNDTDTITNLLPTLKPGLLPIPGSNIEMAVELAGQLLNESGLPKGALFAITDDINTHAAQTIAQELPEQLSLTILGVGTDQGAPIPYDNGFIKNTAGENVIAKRNSPVMKELAEKARGYYLPIQATSDDIHFFLNYLKNEMDKSQQTETQEMKGDKWHEFGPALLLLLLPLVALAFRRGLLLNCICVTLLASASIVAPKSAYASSWWDSLWKNDDQQGLESWQGEDYQAAAEAFKDLQWKSSALYKQGNYNEALEGFSKSDDAIAHYNRGNTLAQLQRYDEAISAYEQALEQRPDLEEAKANKALLEKVKELLEQQQQQEQSPNQASDNNEQSGNSTNNDQSSNQISNNKSGESSEQQNQQQNQQSGSKQQAASENNPQIDNNEQQAHAQLEKEGQEATHAQANALSTEQQQALQQWLRKVPDDPSGLLKNKFEYEFNKRRELYQQGKWKLPDNDAHERY